MERIFELFTTAAALQGFFLGFILLKNNKGNKRGNIFLFSLLCIFSVLIFHSSFIAEKFSRGIKMNEPFLLLIGPFIYFYVREMVSERLSFSIKDIFHFIPFTMFFVIAVPVYIAGPDSTYTLFVMKNIEIIGTVLWFMTLALYIFYMIRIISITGMHEREIENEYSAVDEKGLEWIRKFLYIFLGIFGLFTIGFFIKIFHNPAFNLGKAAAFLSALTIYFMGYRGLRQPDIFTKTTLKREKKNAEEAVIENNAAEIENVIDTGEKYKTSSLKEELTDEIEEKIKAFMEAEKPYLDPEFDLTTLANEIGINKNYVSQVINTKFGYNFFNFVNLYRVEEVKERIKNPENDNYTILSLAFDCGFNSKASFNSIFKKFTGMTPSEYKKG